MAKAETLKHCVHVGVLLTPTQDQKLSELCEATDSTKSSVIRQLIEDAQPTYAPLFRLPREAEAEGVHA